MQYREVMKELKENGTAQNRKVYARHGVGKKMYGVSYANLGKLCRRIKVDHALARKLWASGNHDARILATMVADPAEAAGPLLEAWAKELDNYVLTDAVAALCSKTDLARRQMQKWTRSRQEWLGRAGWHLLAGLAMRDQELPDEFFAPYLATIESDIHRRRNRVRDAMNNALIAIALRNGKLEKQATAAARRIGKIEVDHGETGCKTPDAREYIARAKAHRKRKQAPKKR
jgi:3-methyladenine DNA glycosylase AlkD